MLRRLLLIATGAATIVALTPLGGASAAPSGGCELSGAANITPGLTNDSQQVSYTFHGKLSDCQGLGKVKSGKVSASGSGTASCGSDQTKGSGKILWNTGQASRLRFSTSGAGALLTVTGKITRGHFHGSNVSAQLVFQTDHPQDCAGSGVSNPTFDGPTQIGG